ncbi:hypothetical protein TRICI_005613 [Trichomonascus ciferrii]|uniref:Uncharacterized protein n=1 Tax=Trichomonascus ciferrii TaxID=44093 RepID=A0A642UW52_9ASCO|nr:hypothetical protein TRICI_005613 [Trichomonascus ciferrii]
MHVLRLSPEIVFIICQYLDYWSLLGLRATCRQLKEQATNAIRIEVRVEHTVSTDPNRVFLVWEVFPYGEKELVFKSSPESEFHIPQWLENRLALVRLDRKPGVCSDYEISVIALKKVTNKLINTHVYIHHGLEMGVSEFNKIAEEVARSPPSLTFGAKSIRTIGLRHSQAQSLSTEYNNSTNQRDRFKMMKKLEANGLSELNYFTLSHLEELEFRFVDVYHSHILPFRLSRLKEVLEKKCPSLTKAKIRATISYDRGKPSALSRYCSTLFNCFENLRNLEILMIRLSFFDNPFTRPEPGTHDLLQEMKSLTDTLPRLHTFHLDDPSGNSILLQNGEVYPHSPKIDP